MDCQEYDLITFGCSFTKYSWGTWANILAKELEPVEYINLGKSGAGNQYIFNMLMQADAVYDFTHEDLVVVQWTNVCREDRYIPQKKDSGPWVTPGNIYSQEEYDTNFVMNYFPRLIIVWTNISIKLFIFFFFNIFFIFIPKCSTFINFFFIFIFGITF